MSTGMTEPERRRRRPAVSCTVCRKRKIRCNRESPCNNCLRSKNLICFYEPLPPRVASHHIGQGKTPGLGPNQTSNTTSTSPRSSSLTASTFATTNTLTSSLACVSSPEKQPSSPRDSFGGFSQSSTIHPTSISSPTSTTTENIEETNSSLGGTFYIHNESRSVGRSQAVTRRVTHKTRSFGQSHWINAVTLLKSIFEALEPHLRQGDSIVVSKLQQCKSVARLIKSRRSPSWPTTPTTELPPKDIADQLLECYLRTIETYYRVLHIPTFRRDYEALWTSDRQANKAFIIQVKLVLAIGAAAYNDRFPMRATAIRSIYESQIWLAEPNFKSRLNVQSLQTNILLLIAQEIIDVGGDGTWTSAGTLFRRAVQMGLHRDPSHLPNVPLFVAEIRRRLWNTILEICAQSSLTSGGPPFVSMDDFDTEAPGNYDDDQLTLPQPLLEPESKYTETSIAIALRKTLPSRLAIVKFLNDIAPTNTYEETLRLDANIRTSYKTLCRTLQTYITASSPAPSQFSIQIVDFLMHRYIASLHLPFYEPARTDTSLAFSRKVAIESCLKLWTIIRPLSPNPQTPNTPQTTHSDLPRLAINGSVFHRHGATQATLLIAVELITQLQEETGLGPLSLRPDLLAVTEEMGEWCIQCIEAGETSMKGYLAASLVGAQIEGLRRGLGEGEMAGLLVDAAVHSVERCLPLLEQMAEKAKVERQIEGLSGMSLDASGEMEVGGDWNFMLSDDMLGSGNSESMNWMFNDQASQGFSLW